MNNLNVNFTILLVLFVCMCIGIYIEDNLPMHDHQLISVTALVIVTVIQGLHCIWIYLFH